MHNALLGLAGALVALGAVAIPVVGMLDADRHAGNGVRIAQAGETDNVSMMRSAFSDISIPDDATVDVSDWDTTPVFSSRDIVPYLQKNPNLPDEVLWKIESVIAQYESGIEANRGTVGADVVANIENARALIDERMS